MGAKREAKAKPPSTRTPRRRSVRAKFVLLVVTCVMIAVALVAGGAAWREGAREAGAQTTRLSATAAVIASLSAEAVAAGDRARASQTLRPIGALPGVFYARIERPDGSRLVETGQGARLRGDVMLQDGAGDAGVWSQLKGRVFEVTAPIRSEQRLVGRVVLLSRSEGMLDRFVASLPVSLIAALAAILAGIPAALRLQGSITRPIAALTRSIGAVQTDHDYARTVNIKADDEVGELVDGFNRMLGEIRSRDQRIADHVAGLESEVAALSMAKDAAESAKSDVLATLSHEIRTPMTGMMVMAERLAAGELSPRQRRFAEGIAKSGSSLLSIMNDILDLSRIELGTLELANAPTDVQELAEDVSSLFWEKASSKGLDLAVYVDPATPKLIEGDPTRLRQVIGNLVNNALSFTESGGVLIEIEPDAPGSLRISVRDTGIGIPKNEIGDVFSAFSQADKSTTRTSEGTGLGLAICKRLVEAMNGRFSVTSEVGKGSTFAFRIPVTIIEPAAAWPAAPHAAARAAIVHNGVSTRRALSRYLARAGYSVLAEGDEAQPIIQFGAAGALAKGRAALPTVCLGEYGDNLPHDLLRTGAVHAVLIQPFRRGQLESLLQQVTAGEPLRDGEGEAKAVKAAEVLPTFVGAHVLVADDSAVNREIAMVALSRLGVLVSVVADGRQALDRALAERFDLVLMDGSMPEMDGYEAARAIRAAEGQRGHDRTPIVALTAHAVGSAAEAWRDAGMDAVLYKPFTLAALAKTLAGFIEPGAAPLPSPLVEAAPASAPGPVAAGGKGDFVEKVRGLYRDNPPAAALALPPAPPGVVMSVATAPPEVRALLDDLAEAIESVGQLSMVYQPQFDRAGGRVLGVEALIRWTHPLRGYVSPADFIPIAEAWGGIRKLTDWVMNRCVEETADLSVQVAFNASALEFIDEGIVERIQGVLDRTGFDPKRLEVEITETAILNNEEQVRENMNALRGMGMKVALDDFGAGYSSLGHLRRYPFDKLKIDREFVIDCTRDVQSATVVHAVVSIGRALGMKVVAEGVETEQQRQFLKIAGVHAMQGYLFGKPMPIADLKAMMAPEAIRARA